MYECLYVYIYIYKDIYVFLTCVLLIITITYPKKAVTDFTKPEGSEFT